ncbi:DMT family transporter [Sneathiella sp.]|jgi:drug/metabolite transporter (DMT)-like permease|uniref:DMT family transporter n=1 Tax=Sneathiella sp. TaxID=1964365 RepID=UPI0039E5CDEC
MTAKVPEAAHSGPKLLSENPAVLLLVTGILVGLNFPLGKIGGEAGVSPMLWAMLVSLGVCIILFPVLSLKQRLAWPRGRMVRYIVISAVISFIIPNLLLFSVIPHAGSGYTGLMFALSPVFTLSLATVFRLRTPGKIGLMGIAVGLVGASIVSITRGSAPEAPPVMWLLAALAIPMTLACGNIYRTMDWPDGALPDTLAFWSHLFSVAVFLLLMVAVDGSVPLGDLALSPWAAFAQLVVGGLTFPVFFRLQQKGGPVLLSQLGYVAAAVGLIAATLLLGESYALLTWVGAAVIALGIATTVVAQMKE